MTFSPGELAILRAIAQVNKNPVYLSHIADMAAYSYRHTRRHATALERKNAIRRRRRAAGLPYSYEVLCSF